MRHTLGVLFVPLALAACVGTPPRPAEPQPAAARPTPLYGKLPTGMLVVVDGARLAPGQSVDDVDPAMVENVEIVRGAPARRLYGVEGEQGVILITTRRGGDAARSPWRRR